MTTFEDGPAKGNRLMIKRAPRFLRVVEDAGKFDALDQLTDTPAATEKLYAYELADNPTMCHINCGHGRGGFYPIASYRLFPNQPTDADMRTTERWSQWCYSNK